MVPRLLSSLVVALLLAGLLSAPVLAGAVQNRAQQSTPGATGDGTWTTLDAIPADSVAFTAINLDGSSAQAEAFGRLSRASGLNQLFGLLIGNVGGTADVAGQTSGAAAPSANPADPFGQLLLQLGITELGIGTSPQTGATTATAASSGDVTAALPPFELVMASSDAPTSFQTFLGLLQAVAGATPSPVDVSSYDGAQAYRFDLSGATAAVTGSATPDASFDFGASTPDASGAPAATTELYLATINDDVIVTLSQDSLDASLATANGNDDSLATNAQYVKVADKLAGPALVFAYSDAAAMYQDPMYQGLLSAENIDPSLLGDLNVYTGMRIWADEDAPGLRIDSVRYPSDTGAGTVTPMASPSFSSDLTHKVPDTTMIYLGGNDLGAQLAPALAVGLATGIASGLTSSMTGTLGTVGTPSPDEVQQAQTATGAASDVIGGYLRLFSGEYVVALDPGDALQTGDPSSVFALAATNVDGESFIGGLLSAATRYLSDGSSTSVTTQQVDGGTITTVTSTDPNAPASFSYGIVNGELLVGYGNSVTTYLNGVDSSLADNAQYQQTFTALGVSPDQGSVVYMDLTRLLPILQMAGDGFLNPTVTCTFSRTPVSRNGTPVASPTTTTTDVPCPQSDYATPSVVLSDVDLSNILSFGQVTSAGDGFVESNAIILINDQG